MLKSGLEDPDYNLDRGQAAEKHFTPCNGRTEHLFETLEVVCRLHFYDDYSETCCTHMLCQPESIGSNGVGSQPQWNSISRQSCMNKTVSNAQKLNQPVLQVPMVAGQHP
jgi:hypothetical protein